MIRQTALAVLLAACCQCLPQAARAADAPEACLAPLPAGAADPLVRDVHFHVSSGSPMLGITACIVSNHGAALPSAAANIGIFSKDGVLINYAGQTYSNVAPLANAPAGGPKLVLMFGVSIDVDAKYGQQFAPTTVVALTTGPGQTSTFVLPVQIDQDLARAK